MAEADEKEDEEGLLKPGELLDGRYRIEKELGRGGIGVVYKAFDLEDHIPVAIKMLLEKWAKDRKMVSRFLREGRLAIRARHANIVQILGIKRREGTGTPYIVMEFIEGTVLLDRLKSARDKGQRLGVAILPIARQLAGLLAACHAQKIVHRDLKPANIMLVPDDEAVSGERVKLLDFGIAKMFSDEDEGTQTSVGDQQPGTPAYMAPEQFSTLEKDADPAKMDVYSLGVIMYQALAGKLPLYSPNRMGLMALIMHNEPEPLLKLDPGLPPELTQLVHEMLAKDPTKRPSMDQVRLRLKSGAEVVSVRSTIEINALVPSPASESSQAQTADEPARGAAPSTAPPGLLTPVKSIGERRTEPQPAEAMEQSSVGRGTGQQVTGAETRQRRRRKNFALAAGAAALVVGAASLGFWRFMPQSQPVTTATSAIVPAKVDPATPAEKPAPASESPPKVTTAKDTTPVVAAPVEVVQKPAKGGKSCVPIEPTAACMTSEVSGDMRKGIMAALRDADVKLCPGDRLTILGVEATLKVSHAPKSVPAGIQKDLVFSLRSHLHGAALPGEVEIRCKR